MIPAWTINSPLPVNLTSCVRCRALVVQSDYHCKGAGHPVGSPGRHVRRAVCLCRCYAVDTFFIFDADKIRPRITTSLLFLPAYDWRAPFEGSKHGYA
ncbi:hypothetical protein BJL95_21380 [Methylomonas sp. LWB]|uniref:hypothetical protein n=1 Tax=Methylomonas sp. LWB TaxID=1905845 RepID=UPI0008D9ABB5|nr:hypothetical protein [Methylomonas sp. LWB]OHX37220.1 hypothetical protein BJL95_21380 [Methylomonas sp. LWB]